jgi:hypothetical protein
MAASVAALLVATSAWAQSANSGQPDAGSVQQAADSAGQTAKQAADNVGQKSQQAVQETKDSGPALKQDSSNLGNDFKKDSRQLTKDLPAAGDNSPANQAPAGTKPWSAISAQTMGEGRNLIAAEAGFPGVTVTYLHGHTDTFDIGAKLGFLYGSEGADPNLGFRGQAAMRWLLFQQNNVKMGLEVEPGLYQTFIGPVAGGIVLPVKYTAAFAVTDSLYLHAGVDIPMMLGFGHLGTGFTAPILFGGGAEYFITDAISITAKLRIGPSFDAGAYFLDQDLYGNKGQVVRLGFNAAVGASFRL